VLAVVDPVEDDVLRRPPRHPDEPMLGPAQWRFIVATGLLLAAVTLGVADGARSSRRDRKRQARTATYERRRQSLELENTGELAPTRRRGVEWAVNGNAPFAHRQLPSAG
jgi:hypothetical protein